MFKLGDWTPALLMQSEPNDSKLFGLPYDDEIQEALRPHIRVLKSLIGTKNDPRITSIDLPICRYYKSLHSSKSKRATRADSTMLAGSFHWSDLARVRRWLFEHVPGLSEANHRHHTVVIEHSVTLLIAFRYRDVILAQRDCPSGAGMQEEFLLRHAFSRQRREVHGLRHEDVEFNVISALEAFMFSPHLNDGHAASQQWGGRDADAI